MLYAFLASTVLGCKAVLHVIKIKFEGLNRRIKTSVNLLLMVLRTISIEVEVRKLADYR